MNLLVGMSSKAFPDYGEAIVMPERESLLLKEVSHIALISKNVWCFRLENRGMLGGQLLQRSRFRDLLFKLGGRVLASSKCASFEAGHQMLECH